MFIPWLCLSYSHSLIVYDNIYTWVLNLSQLII